MSSTNEIGETEDERLELARTGFPLTRHCTYLNSAGLGPVSSIYAETLARCTDEDVRRGRAIAERFRRIEDARERIRSELAGVLGCAPARLTLTRSTSDGLERVLSSFDWQPGDEVVSTSVEHEACTVPLRRETGRAGVGLRFAEVPPTAPDDLGWLTESITPRTRLIAFSAVGFETGVRLPIDAIATAASERGILTLVDAAQCAGAAEIDIEATGIDYCAAPAQKWLCGPEGLGGLYTSDAGRAALNRELGDSARHGLGVLEATAAHLEWLRGDLGWDWIHSRTAALTRHLRRTVARTSALSLVDAGPFAGISTIRCRAADSAAARAEIERQGFVLRHLPDHSAFRVAASFINSISEIEDIVKTLSTLS